MVTRVVAALMLVARGNHTEVNVNIQPKLVILVSVRKDLTVPTKHFPPSVKVLARCCELHFKEELHPNPEG